MKQFIAQIGIGVQVSVNFGNFGRLIGTTKAVKFDDNNREYYDIELRPFCKSVIIRAIDLEYIEIVE